ncbi:Translocon-associated protein subunit delta-like Protein [Tribolium castaneum]|uniref:Translocon-associated protein subunit delta n=1 Tax=Tribolium castaneum TaxID=7070 RepID=D6W9S5_TRICA|nr:PREDICTED: translocon-associated protein subunit delta [Tribolium castaneum]EEZ98538.1 Translocon-associated protein subunit delta-like Protein [Tribolium castaneum]|eukprot:XP_974837.1 PREDICTED: translocon-associated protein subunit delta [Tribolium castaneum]
MNKIPLFFVFQVFLISGAFSSCENPEIKSTSYTTQDATILTHIAYISEFNVKCGSGSLTNLYSLLGDTIQPVGMTGPNKYQISWTEEVKNARNGDITIKLFDDDGYALLRKAQRAGDDLKTVPHFAVITINHPGTYKGPWISCECLAVAFSLVVCYYAIHFRSKLLA